VGRAALELDGVDMEERDGKARIGHGGSRWMMAGERRSGWPCLSVRGVSRGGLDDEAGRGGPAGTEAGGSNTIGEMSPLVAIKSEGIRRGLESCRGAPVGAPSGRVTTTSGGVCCCVFGASDGRRKRSEIFRMKRRDLTCGERQ